MIDSFEIENFRGFYGRKRIAFAKPNNEIGSGLTVLVGPNNSGKTTIIDGLRLLSRNAAPIDVEHRHEGYRVRLTAIDTDGRSKTLTNPDLGAITTIEGDAQALQTHSLRFVPSRRAWSAYSGQSKMDPGSYWHNLTEHRPITDEWLVGRLASLSQEEKVRYERLLKTLIPQIHKWRVELSRNNLFVQYEAANGAKHSAELFGDGMASLFRIALAIHDSTVDQCVIIDEPELSLHPQAQKLLAQQLSKLSADRQVLVTTHSPYFVSWDDLAAGATIYRLSQSKAGVEISNLSSQTISSVSGLFEDWQKPNLLDPVAREIFFADDVVFLEGQEDIGLLRKFARSQSLEPLSAFGYGVGGAGNIKHFLKMANELGIRAAAIYDGDKENDYSAAKALFPDVMIKLLPVSDIRDKKKRDQSGRETEVIEKEGLFDSRGVIKPKWASYLKNLISEIQTYMVGEVESRMPLHILCVRAIVPDASKRAAFDVWYSKEHLPDAAKSFGALHAWRYWLANDPAVHLAMYEFPDRASLDTANEGEEIKRLVKDFDRDWPDVKRTREILVLAEEWPAQ